MGFPVPPYSVIDICGTKNQEDFLLEKIDALGIPNKIGHMVGLTIRVSMPGELDKLAKHGSLHATNKKQIIAEMIEKCATYGDESKIILQHTVDAKCSGAILKESDRIIIEAIAGDAPPLLEGQVAVYETWIYFPEKGNWKKERSYSLNNIVITLLSATDLGLFERFFSPLPSDCYLEWSLSKDGYLYFYEFLKLTHF